MPTDLEIAQAAQPKRIQEIAEKRAFLRAPSAPMGSISRRLTPCS